MEYKVRLLDGTESKGVQELERELVENHEQQLEAESQAQQVEFEPEATTTEQVASQVDLKDEDVLSYLGKRYNKQINSFDELMAERQDSEPLPEDVSAYLKYKKDTGRGFEDFIQLKKDFESMNPEQLLKEYLTVTQEGLDSDDIEALLEDYHFDEEMDDESTIKKAKIAKRKFLLRLRNTLILKRKNTGCPLSQAWYLFLMKRSKCMRAISNIPNRQRP